MARQLRAFVHIDGAVYGPDDDVPEKVARQITNPKSWATDVPMPAVEPAAAEPVEPPRSGPGSGRDAWVAYAAACGVEVDPDASREAIMQAVDKEP